jgi:transglutaminase-like putative cysteine protease
VRLDVSCNLSYAVSGPSVFFFNIAPPNTPFQRVETEELLVSPGRPIEEFTDPDGRNRYHRVEVQGGEMTVSYRATVSTEPAPGPNAAIIATPPILLPPHVLPFVVPSRHCESDLLLRMAWKEFGSLPETIERPERIADWIHGNVDYLVGYSGSMTSAFNTATARAGVCRDFAHLGIALCRAINVPARFVSAYASDLRPPDFHAVFEAWLDGHWYVFDATRMASRTSLVRIGTGRDAAEVSFALIFGPAFLTSLNVSAEPSGPQDRRPA